MREGQQKIAVYPGSFDPITNGHIDVIVRALHIFDSLIIGVTKNPEKKPTFPIDKRLKMIKESTKHLPNVTVETFDGLLVEFARKKKAQAVIRGMRALSGKFDNFIFGIIAIVSFKLTVMGKSDTCLRTIAKGILGPDKA